MKTTLLVPTLSRFDLLNRLLQSAESQKIDDYIIIDNSNGLLELENKNVITTHNIGVAGSWNIGLREYSEQPDRLLIICNDDNVLQLNAVQELTALATANSEHGFYASRGGGFSFFALVPYIAVRTVGYFDEGFYPAYFEDNDYHYRMKLAGVDFICSEHDLYELGVNGQGSQTINSNMTREQDKVSIRLGYEANHMRYKAKWGGETGQETYTTPFNLR
jgi:GT2 family glycosyltransferase